MPDAVYTFRIDRAEIKKAAGEGKEPYINLMLKCIDEGEWLGRAVWDILTLAKGKTFKLDQLLKDALGWARTTRWTTRTSSSSSRSALPSPPRRGSRATATVTRS